MAHRNVIPFGPQHPVLPEPIHFDLVTEDEQILDAIPSISYVHRDWRSWSRKEISSILSTWPTGSAASAASCTPWDIVRPWKRL